MAVLQYDSQHQIGNDSCSDHAHPCGPSEQEAPIHSTLSPAGGGEKGDCDCCISGGNARVEDPPLAGGVPDAAFAVVPLAVPCVPPCGTPGTAFPTESATVIVVVTFELPGGNLVALAVTEAVIGRPTKNGDSSVLPGSGEPSVASSETR